MSKATVEELNQAFEDFKKANDERWEQIKAKGRADPLLEEKVNKANAAIDEVTDKLKAQADELKAAKEAAERAEVLLKRLSRGSGGGSGGGIEQKHLDELALLRGKESVTEDEYREHKAAFQRFMRKGDTSKLEALESKAMSVDSNPDGGFYVLPDTSGRVVQKVFESSPMRQYASVQAISTDALEGTNDLDEAGSGWVAERQARTETSTPEIGMWRIPVHEIYAEPRATQKLLDDSSIDVEAWLAGKVASRFSRQEASAFVNGDGVVKPRGFLTYPDGTPSKTAWKVIKRVKSGADAAFLAAAPGDVFIDMVHTLKTAYLSGAVWAMNRVTLGAARKIKDAEDRYFFSPDLANSPSGTIYGYPVALFEDMPSYNAAADTLGMAFGNFADAYQIVDRVGIRVLRDPYTSKPWVKFYTTKRVGGDVINHEALVICQFGD